MPQITRKLTPGRLVIASHNQGKIREINDLVSPYNIEAISAAALDLEEPEETGTTYEANAQLKAHASAKAAGLPALADDSGLSVDALGGAPGIYSARWAGEPRDFGRAMARVEDELRAIGGSNNLARFVCVLCLAWPDGEDVIFRGEVEGMLSFPPRGEHGFGYDPIFTPTGYDQTFGEMDPAHKHSISHRAQAFEQLKAALP